MPGWKPSEAGRRSLRPVVAPDKLAEKSRDCCQEVE